MTPSNIEVLVHCYMFRKPHPRSETSTVQESINRLLSNGLIQRELGPSIILTDTPYYTTTERGNAHMQQLQNLPRPILRTEWIDQHGNVISEMSS